MFDERILSEYYAVLNYSKFGFSDIPNVIDSQMNLILSKGIYVNKVKELDLYFKDKTDIPFYEVISFFFFAKKRIFAMFRKITRYALV